MSTFKWGKFKWADHPGLRKTLESLRPVDPPTQVKPKVEVK